MKIQRVQFLRKKVSRTTKELHTLPCRTRHGSPLFKRNHFNQFLHPGMTPLASKAAVELRSLIFHAWIQRSLLWCETAEFLRAGARSAMMQILPEALALRAQCPTRTRARQIVPTRICREGSIAYLEFLRALSIPALKIILLASRQVFHTRKYNLKKSMRVCLSSVLFRTVIYYGPVPINVRPAASSFEFGL